MDRKVFAEYIEIKGEARDLRNRIKSIESEISRLGKLEVTDSVSCGKKGKKPLRTVKIRGKPEAAIARKEAALKSRKKKMEMLETRLLEMAQQVEEFIEQIPTSELRILFRLYYIDGLTWVQVAHRMNQVFPKRKKKYTEDSCRKKHNRFFEEI